LLLFLALIQLGKKLGSLNISLKVCKTRVSKHVQLKLVASPPCCVLSDPNVKNGGHDGLKKLLRDKTPKGKVRVTSHKEVPDAIVANFQ